MNFSISIRPLLKDDHAFVFATYLRNKWYNKDNTSTLIKDTWFKVMHLRLERLMATTRIDIACLAEDPDTIIGYKIHDKEPFTYIKKDFRDIKIFEENI